MLQLGCLISNQHSMSALLSGSGRMGCFAGTSNLFYGRLYVCCIVYLLIVLICTLHCKFVDGASGSTDVMPGQCQGQQ
jgi:hypothetical protein